MTHYSKIPYFEGNDYHGWSNRMEQYLMSLGYSVWNMIHVKFLPSLNEVTDERMMKKHEYNAKAANALLSALSPQEYTRVMNLKSAKDIWDKLKSFHEGDLKVKEAKLQVHRSEYEALRMSSTENFQCYMDRVFKVVNEIRSLGEDLPEVVVVKKILRSLPPMYNPKVSVLEDKDLSTVTLDELQSMMVAYEMRMEMSGPIKSNNEISF